MVYGMALWAWHVVWPGEVWHGIEHGLPGMAYGIA